MDISSSQEKIANFYTQNTYQFSNPMAIYCIPGNSNVPYIIANLMWGSSRYFIQHAKAEIKSFPTVHCPKIVRRQWFASDWLRNVGEICSHAKDLASSMTVHVQRNLTVEYCKYAFVTIVARTWRSQSVYFPVAIISMYTVLWTPSRSRDKGP